MFPRAMNTVMQQIIQGEEVECRPLRELPSLEKPEEMDRVKWGAWKGGFKIPTRTVFRPRLIAYANDQRSLCRRSRA